MRGRGSSRKAWGNPVVATQVNRKERQFSWHHGHYLLSLCWGKQWGLLSWIGWSIPSVLEPPGTSQPVTVQWQTAWGVYIPFSQCFHPAVQWATNLLTKLAAQEGIVAGTRSVDLADWCLPPNEIYCQPLAILVLYRNMIMRELLVHFLPSSIPPGLWKAWSGVGKCFWKYIVVHLLVHYACIYWDTTQ